MANVKISALPAATTPLAGTEVLPIVQSGVTAKVSVADLTSGRAITAYSITDSTLTSGRVTYAGTAGLLQDSANLLFNGTTLTANTLNLTNALGIAYGGTGQITANASFNALAPSQTGNSGKYLTTDGANTSWATNPLGTVTSITAGTGLTGGTITTSGTIAIDTTVVATLTGTQTLTNKTISGASNTLSNIGNASLTNSAITINGTSTSLGGSISVGTVTNVSGTAPVSVATGTSTPVISMAAANTSTNGYLTSTDWNTFNGKSNTNGTVTSVAALTLGTTGTDLTSTVATGTTTPVITLNVPTASAANRGALSSADWTTFNGKQAALVSGTNIKTVNGTTLLGSGDLGIITGTYGGTGINNGANTITIAGNLTHAGAFTQSFTATANTAVTLPAGATAASNNLLSSATAVGIVTGTPSSTTYLRGDGTWSGVSGASGGTVTSVAATVPAFLSITGSPITTAGTLAIAYSGTALPVANGGTGLTSLTAGYIPFGAGTSAFGSNANLFWDNTNSRLGVGTVSPTGKLDVQGGRSYFAANGDAFATYLRYDNATAGVFVGSPSANAFQISSSGGGAYLNIDSSGNVGIGVAPSDKLDVNGNIRIASGNVLRFVDAGTVRVSIQGDTSSNAIFNTAGSERMRIDSSGNVGIGTSSPTVEFAAGTSLKVLAASTYSTLALSTTRTVADGNRIGSLVFDMPNNTATYQTRAVVEALMTGSTANKYGANLIFSTATDNTQNPTERMRIDSSGNVGIGTTPSAWNSSNNVKALQIGTFGAMWQQSSGAVNLGANAYEYTASAFKYITSNPATLYSQDTGNGIHTWSTAASGTAGNVITFSERMRIDSSGNLLVGTTSTQASSKFLVSIIPGTTTGYATLPTTATGYTAATFLNSVAAGIGSITTTTVATLFNTTSDYRLKEDVTPIQNALATVNGLNPVSFTWKNGYKDDGFLAHEIQAVIPNCVTGKKDAVDENGKPVYQQMDSSGVIPFLVKAMQEQQALIESLTTRLTALENK